MRYTNPRLLYLLYYSTLSLLLTNLFCNMMMEIKIHHTVTDGIETKRNCNSRDKSRTRTDGDMTRPQ